MRLYQKEVQRKLKKKKIKLENGKLSICQKWKEQQFCAEETGGQANACTEDRT